MRLSLSLLITGSRSSLVRALLPTNPLKIENIPFPAPLLPASSLSINQSINQSINRTCKGNQFENNCSEYNFKNPPPQKKKWKPRTFPPLYWYFRPQNIIWLKIVKLNLKFRKLTSSSDSTSMFWRTADLPTASISAWSTV